MDFPPHFLLAPRVCRSGGQTVFGPSVCANQGIDTVVMCPSLWHRVCATAIGTSCPELQLHPMRTWTPEPKRVLRVPLCRQHGQAHPTPNVSQNCVNSSSFCGIQSSYLSIRSPRTLPSCVPGRPTQSVCPHGPAKMASCSSTISPNVSQNCVDSSSFCGIFIGTPRRGCPARPCQESRPYRDEVLGGNFTAPLFRSSLVSLCVSSLHGCFEDCICVSRWLFVLNPFESGTTIK
jgi:hypothetical protein